jgi:2-keto-4-pentenoate hydratase/2-oxohepta-3-ene-1,7-dioic acid hydratase in catechol pathway
MTGIEDYDAVPGLGVRLANLQGDDGPTLGVERNDGAVLDVAAIGRSLGLSAPRDMDHMLQCGLGLQVKEILTAVDRAPADFVAFPIGDVRFAPLVTRPQKIVCVGFNYRKHAEETGTPTPKEPPLFAKYRNALNHDGGVIMLPTAMDNRFDYETELVVVIGRRCKNIKEEEALNYVAGYATGNDVSARTRQVATSQFTAGKTADGFAPVGPWLVTRDLVPNPNNLRIRTWVNGQLRQDWTTRDMIYDCRKLIAYCSNVMTLEAGDLLFTGTPQGVIFGEKAPPEERRWLKAGDEVVSELEGLGRLSVRLA